MQRFESQLGALDTEVREDEKDRDAEEDRPHLDSMRKSSRQLDPRREPRPEPTFYPSGTSLLREARSVR